MTTISKPLLDDSTLEEGPSRFPLLPSSLLAQWGDEGLPSWVCLDLALPADSPIKSLGNLRTDWASVPPRCRNFVTYLVDTRREAIHNLLVLDRPWPIALKAENVPWKTRTRTCLARAGLLEPHPQLETLTFGILLDTPGMGAQSVLDFACTLEAAIGEVEKQVPIPLGADVDNASATLLAVLDEPWSHWVSERDPRFASLLPPGKGTFTERIDALTSTPEMQSRDVELLAKSVEGLRSKIAQLDTLPLESQIRELISSFSGVQDKRLDAVTARLHGHGGEVKATLEEAAGLVGLTRERIRQLESRTLKRWPPHPVVMPGLDRALATLASNLPLTPDAAALKLQAAGISQHPFHPASLIAVAVACGRPLAFQLEEVLGSTMVVAAPAGPLAATILQTAYRQASSSGATNVEQIVSEIEQGGFEVTSEQVRELLRIHGQVEFLNDDWIWCPGYGKHPVRNISRRMLSVTSPLDVGHLREGIKGVFRFRVLSGMRSKTSMTVPPREVLLAYYHAHPEFVVLDSGKIRATAPLDYRAELGTVEQTIVTVLRSSPAGVLDRTSLGEECLERGVNANSLWTIAGYSPVVERLGAGLWTLRGTQLDPAAVEAVRVAAALRPREKRVQDFGWKPDGTLWIAFRVPPAFETKNFYLPASICRYLDGRDYEAFTTDGRACGIIRIYGQGQSAGYSPFLRMAGADEGDLLLATFSLAGASVTLEIIEEDELEELSPEA